MANASTAAANAALDGIASAGLMAYATLHTAAPGSTGANEMASVTRQACSWNAASGGSKTNSTALSFTTPGTVAATHAGEWSAATAGSYGVAQAFSSSVTATTITVAAGALTESAS